ncbi:Tify domain-containing protein [Heracleum sosnowskyi]|uniref:Protein TIFY n=1 Tax=Heracleum sosnowskyi TaxID=360622 RepID=A0AAD8GLP3_9APIA|nr:Tify domain-containing protein [Heracleum sosnowskyi]
MERDFMGLYSKGSVIEAKEDAAAGYKDSPVFLRCPQLQCPLTNAFNSNKCQSGENQRASNQNMEGGTSFSMTNYPIQQNAHPLHLPPHGAKAFVGMNQGISLSMNNSFFKTQFAGAGQNLAAASTKPHYLGGVLVTAPHSNPSYPYQTSTKEERLSQITSGAPVQMTIFYGGTVNVFDDISPEKAQAIMLLAGSGPSASYHNAQPRHQLLAPSPKHVAQEVFRSQPLITPPCSGLSSPMSVSSRPMRQTCGGSTKNDGLAKINRGSTKPVDQAPKVATSVHVAGTSRTTMTQSAVPQARKASLARFLEKRKERTMSSAPYNNLSKTTEGSATPGSSSVHSENSGSRTALYCVIYLIPTSLRMENILSFGLHNHPFLHIENDVGNDSITEVFGLNNNVVRVTKKKKKEELEYHE